METPIDLVLKAEEAEYYSECAGCPGWFPKDEMVEDDDGELYCKSCSILSVCCGARVDVLGHCTKCNEKA